MCIRDSFYSANWKDNPSNEEETFRLGVAVSEKPEGPFEDLSDAPIFDPGYPIIDANVYEEEMCIRDRLNTGSLLDALEFGDAMSAVKNTVPGDLPDSSFQEITRIIKAHQSEGAQSEMDR